MATYNTRVEYDGTGSQRLFAVPFTPILDEYTKVYDAIGEVTAGWSYDRSNSRIEWDTAPANEYTFIVKRETDRTDIFYSFTDGTFIDGENLHGDFLQLIDCIQEDYDTLEAGDDSIGDDNLTPEDAIAEMRVLLEQAEIAANAASTSASTAQLAATESVSAAAQSETARGQAAASAQVAATAAFTSATASQEAVAAGDSATLSEAAAALSETAAANSASEAAASEASAATSAAFATTEADRAQDISNQLDLGVLDVQLDGNVIDPATISMNFVGAVDVEQDSPGNVTLTMTGGGGGTGGDGYKPDWQNEDDIVIFVSGQSNLVWPRSSNPPSVMENNDNIQVLQAVNQNDLAAGSVWGTIDLSTDYLAPGIDTCVRGMIGDNSGSISYSLANEVQKANPGSTVWLMQIALGGSSIFQWLPAGYDYPELVKATERYTPGELNQALLDYIDEGLAGLPVNAKLGMFMWAQGGGDGDQPGWQWAKAQLAMRDLIASEFAVVAEDMEQYVVPDWAAIRDFNFDGYLQLGNLTNKNTRIVSSSDYENSGPGDWHSIPKSYDKIGVDVYLATIGVYTSNMNGALVRQRPTYLARIPDGGDDAREGYGAGAKIINTATGNIYEQLDGSYNAFDAPDTAGNWTRVGNDTMPQHRWKMNDRLDLAAGENIIETPIYYTDCYYGIGFADAAVNMPEVRLVGDDGFAARKVPSMVGMSAKISSDGAIFNPFGIGNAFICQAEFHSEGGGPNSLSSYAMGFWAPKFVAYGPAATWTVIDQGACIIDRSIFAVNDFAGGDTLTGVRYSSVAQALSVEEGVQVSILKGVDVASPGGTGSIDLHVGVHMQNSRAATRAAVIVGTETPPTGTCWGVFQGVGDECANKFAGAMYNGVRNVQSASKQPMAPTDHLVVLKGGTDYEMSDTATELIGRTVTIRNRSGSGQSSCDIHPHPNDGTLESSDNPLNFHTLAWNKSVTWMLSEDREWLIIGTGSV